LPSAKHSQEQKTHSDPDSGTSSPNMAHKLTSISTPAKNLYPRIFLICALISLGLSQPDMNCTRLYKVLTGLTVTKSYTQLKVLFQLPSVIESLVTT